MNGIIKIVENNRYEGLGRLNEAYNDAHLENLIKAVLQVDDTYYYYSLHHRNGPSQMQEQLERVFAYELYYHWSVLLKEYNDIQDTVNKRVINGEAGKKLDGFSVYPDMILHKGQEDWHHQEIAVEIKRKISLSEDNLLNDLEKLSDLLEQGKLANGATPFKYGVFILTGGEEKDLIPLLRKEDVESINDNIICIFCSKKGELKYKSMDEIKGML